MKRRSRASDHGLLLSAVSCIVLAAASAALAWPWSTPGESGGVSYPDVTAERDWLKGRVGRKDVVVLDARDGGSYEAGHIAGAVSLPASSLLDARAPELPYVLGDAGLDGDAAFVVYGDDTLSPEACLLFWQLELAGAERVSVLIGGLSAWSGDGLTTETGPAAASSAPTAWKPTPVMERLSSIEYVRDTYGKKGIEIIDARGRDAWAGDPAEGDDGPCVRSGHIPHALPYDFDSFLKPDGGLDAPEENRKTFGMTGPRPSSPVNLSDEFVVYGVDALDGAVGYFLLRRAGVASVSLFPGGWSEWAADPDLPLVRIVSAEELLERLDRERSWGRSNAPPKSFALFDVRHPATHARGHVPGSIAISSGDFADSLEIYMERHWPELDRESAAIVTYCYGPNCIRSRYTSTVAARAGFIRVERFFGGMEEWREAGGRVARK